MIPSSRTSLHTSAGRTKKRVYLPFLIILLLVGAFFIDIPGSDKTANISPEQINANLLGTSSNTNEAVVTNNPASPTMVMPNLETSSAPPTLNHNNTPSYPIPTSPAAIPAPNYNSSLIPINAPQTEPTNIRQPVSSSSSIPELPRPIGRASKPPKKPSALTQGQEPTKDFHTVVRGDNLSKICLHYYKTIRYVDELADYNHLSKDERLKINQRIELPSLQKLSQNNQASGKSDASKTLKFTPTDNGKVRLASSSDQSEGGYEMYCVQPNESLIKISKKKRVSFLLLYECNKNALPNGDPDQLDTGMTLRIPLAKSK